MYRGHHGLLLGIVGVNKDVKQGVASVDVPDQLFSKKTKCITLQYFFLKKKCGVLLVIVRANGADQGEGFRLQKRRQGGSVHGARVGNLGVVKLLKQDDGLEEEKQNV